MADQTHLAHIARLAAALRAQQGEIDRLFAAFAALIEEQRDHGYAEGAEPALDAPVPEPGTCTAMWPNPEGTWRQCAEAPGHDPADVHDCGTWAWTDGTPNAVPARTSGATA